MPWSGRGFAGGALWGMAWSLAVVLCVWAWMSWGQARPAGGGEAELDRGACIVIERWVERGVDRIRVHRFVGVRFLEGDAGDVAVRILYAGAAGWVAVPIENGVRSAVCGPPALERGDYRV